ncbi:MAG: aminopeptidase P family protein, partial [Lawsonibacter sp.]|nr:aminopeptidase P family protein [Lawsonibacter sp.]
MTEREIAARLVYELLSRGGEKVSFDPIVAAGPNGSRPHAVPGDQVADTGMFITMDFGCKVGGYCSDMTRTVALGQPTQEMEEVYNAVLAAQKAGINAARAGVTGQEIDAAARQVLQEAGYGEYFSHGFGHSLGVDIHEAPSASSKEKRPMPAGAVISAEPGVYLPGRFGVRIEDVLILNETGCEDITRSPKDLIVL